MATSAWSTKRVLIVVRTYPVPAQKGVEVSCTAGITREGEWIRLFPVPYRFLDEDKRFKKYQWIDVSVTKARGDRRPESFKLNDASIRIIEHVPPDGGWRKRDAFIAPLRRPSLCSIQREQSERGSPTLGVFRPAAIDRLIIEPSNSEWTAKQRAILNQQLLALTGSPPTTQLEKIPFEFRYAFRCAEPECDGHKITCFDWEMAQSYRRWKREYGEKWEEKFRQRYELEMSERFDTQFFVGTVHRYPDIWIIVGLYYPPKPASLPLFGGRESTQA